RTHQFIRIIYFILILLYGCNLRIRAQHYRFLWPGPQVGSSSLLGRTNLFESSFYIDPFIWHQFIRIIYFILILLYGSNLRIRAQRYHFFDSVYKLLTI
ncbi:hypothetical protein, partial [Aliiglaciecola sp. NS0011-25]|uniref:hypothetical protein n=1 Tax=Aliiglaciecola sp. NS0011-25 TaxID=3127654 RepID=UPI003342D986